MHWRSRSSLVAQVTRAAALLLLVARGGAADLKLQASVERGAIKIAVTDKNDTTAGGASARTREIGSCHLRVWETDDGLIRAAQVIKSTRYAELDKACLKSELGKKIAPTRVDGHPIDQWVTLTIIWEAKGSLAANPAKAPDRPDLPIAALVPDQELHLRPPYYPQGALARREQGDCVVRAEVSAQGHVEQASVTEASGSEQLDATCLDAIRAARFSPAEHDQKPVSATTDIALHWQLPDAPSTVAGKQ
jgi:TonB family protein